MDLDQLQDSVWEILKDGPDEISIQAVILFVIRENRKLLETQISNLHYTNENMIGVRLLDAKDAYEQCKTEVLLFIKGK